MRQELIIGGIAGAVIGGLAGALTWLGGGSGMIGGAILGVFVSYWFIPAEVRALLNAEGSQGDGGGFFGDGGGDGGGHGGGDCGGGDGGGCH